MPRSRSPPRRARLPRPCSTTTTPISPCSRDKTVAILGYGSRATPTRSTSRTPASTWWSGSARLLVRRAGPREEVERHRRRRRRVARRRGDGAAPRRATRRGRRDQIQDGIAPGRRPAVRPRPFSVHYGEVEPPPKVDVALVAPKGPGHLVRRQYVEGSGVPGLVAVDAERRAGRSSSRSPTPRGSGARSAA